MSSILNALYTIVIGPLELLFEAIFYTTNRFVTPGISIIILSFVLNILLLPLYNRAEEIQKQENDTQARLKPVVDHIKKSFKGDEQYMMLQTYYKINGYKPYYALRGSISLLIQIPFFIAAYSFLSSLSLLNESSFGIISDLGKPDGLLFGFNLLPILMTAINVVSCMVYTKGQPLKSKIQLYIMAVLFLVLLYNKPAGLSFYYLLNNLFSLIKNILNKLQNKNTIITYSIVFVVAVGMLALPRLSNFTSRAKVLILIAMISILLITMFHKKIFLLFMDKFQDTKYSNLLFLVNVIFIAVLVGMYIPSQVIVSSPEEFVDTSTMLNPCLYIIHSLEVALGLFVLWPSIYYCLMRNQSKIFFSFCSSIIVFVSLCNYCFFGNNLGNMSNCLVYDIKPSFTTKEHILNIFMIIATALLILLIYKKYRKVLLYCVMVVCVSAFLISTINVNKIYDAYYSLKEKIKNNDSGGSSIVLSKEGNNVVVIMLDRAISSFYPYILEEVPNLKAQFEGFTYYPNTVSFGGSTNISTPSLFGGYEYTPEELDKRDKELLKNKHNEALKVMPAIFSNNGYGVTIFDPPYAGYTHIPDLSIYNDSVCQNVKAYNTSENVVQEQIKRNLLVYGISKICPTPLFVTIYSNGNYLNVSPIYNLPFEFQYATLEKLNTMTKTNDSFGEVLIFQNSATHEPTLLEEPNYVFSNDNKKIEYDGIVRTKKANGNTMTLDTETQLSHYHVNAASLIQIGNWLDYLKRNDVYDNTKIVICSDHGHSLGVIEDMVLEDDDLMRYNPLLLVKDFNSRESNIDNSFMTLADIPYLATEGLIENPINPYTKKEIVKQDKTVDFHIFKSSEISIYENNGNKFVPGNWYSVSKNCLDIINWTKIK